ncbi:hypothetical protein KY331_04550 [Candidatus Woesearchaeota archaeon]|nr:hypothetical protein [Candidatus Woesearchaeota archaeon]
MTKKIIYDTGSIISLVTNNLLWILEPLKEQFGGEFYITPAVKEELINKPLKTKRFELEAMQVFQYIKRGIIKVIDQNRIKEMADKLLFLANHSFRSHGKWIKIVHEAEIEVLAADAVLDASAVVIDERTVRIFLENSPKLTELMEKRLHSKIKPHKNNIKDFKKILEDVQVIRSTEIVTIAYKLGLLDEYQIKEIDSPKKRLLDAALWALKIRGCAISKKEIEEIIKLEA